MPTKPPAPPLLTGLQKQFVSNPVAETPRGGVEFGFSGESSGKPIKAPSGAPGGYDENGVQGNQYANMGYVLESDDKDVFQHVHGLVLRQEIPAMNRLAYDTHWAYVATGYPWSELIKVPNRDTYTQRLPYGSIRTQAVPNKAWDLLNKTAETLLVDFPQAEAEPLDSSEEAEAACDLATKFLEQDAGELGTNDAQLFYERVQRALFTPTSFIECWTDPTGAGYVPLEIEAHPQAVDPNTPLVDGEGNPTVDYVLRMVTQAPEQGPDGTPTFPPGTQFTDDPEQAAPLWLPRLRAAKWNREHVRVYPEDVRVENAEKVIILGYCTLSEARRRWAAVADMESEELTHLTDWTPPRYLSLLPPHLRSRWKLTDGRDKERAGSSDERLMFYYHIYIKACPDYPKGADVVVSGIDGGMILDKRFLSRPVKLPNDKTEIRCMEIPVVQITPIPDPFEMDPQGRAFIELFAGAVENNAHLALGFQQLIDKIIHTPFTINSTSPVSGDIVKQARATEDFIVLKNPQDKPEPLTPPPLPASFFQMYELSDESINSIAAQNRPAQGSDKQAEVSGRAREIAVQQNNVANTSKSNVVNMAYARWCRIKTERAMSDFETPQMVRYEGEDGAQKVREWTGIDFALVGRVVVKAGTGTMMTPDQKVQYLGNLQAAGLLPTSEAAEAARHSYSKRLGIAPDPHEQFVERCIGAWMKGPPSPEWVQQYQQWKQAQAEYQAQQAQYQSAAALFQQAQQAQAIAAGGAPPTGLGPESQNDQAMIQYQQAVQWLGANAGQIPPAPPQPPQPPEIPEPWSPFTSRPNETEPAIAGIWARKLSLVISSTKYDRFGPEWADVLTRKYTAMRQAVATATGATPASPPQSQPVGTPQPEKPVQSPSFPGPRPSNSGRQMPTQQNASQAVQNVQPQQPQAAARAA